MAKVKSLILDVIHQVSMIEWLIRENVADVDDWAWHKQLKIVREGQSLKLLMANSRFDYTF